MKPTHHAIISVAVAIPVVYWTKSYPAGLACLLGGIFIDIDHHIDFMLAKGRFPFKYQELWDFCGETNNAKLHLFFHSYELLALAWGIVAYLGWPAFWLGGLIGVSVHMLCDQVVNPLKPWGYFLVYRLRHGFERKYIFTKEYYEKVSQNS